MNFWPFSKSDNKVDTVEAENAMYSSPKRISQFRFMGQQLQEFMKNNLPVGFQKKINQTKPYILASFAAWPVYWMIRGFEWKQHRVHTQLPMYIQKTYLQAKILQFSIIMIGLTMASLEEIKERRISQNISNDTKDF